MLIMVAVTINLGHGDWWRRVVSGTAKTNKGHTLFKRVEEWDRLFRIPQRPGPRNI